MKLKTILLSIAAISLVACNSDDTEAPQPKLKTVTATLPQNGNGTRVALEYDATGNQMKVAWTTDDEIKLSDGDGTLYPLTSIDPETGAATFRIPENTPDLTGFTYGTHTIAQSQSSTAPLAHLAGAHAMTGQYDEGTNTITFAHTVSVLRIALSGLKPGTTLTSLTVGSYTLTLNGNSADGDGEFVAWLSMKAGIDIEDLTFTVNYADGDSQTYIHPFPAGATLPADKLLHCTINMETKVGFINDAETGAIWGVPEHVVPPGYNYVVYDEASFLEMPVGNENAGKKIIQVADIALSGGLDGTFQGIYNGNGYTINGTSGYAFSNLYYADIANVHVRGGIGLADTPIVSKISHCSAVGNTMVNKASNVFYFTLCSTDQAELVNNGTNSLYVACWFGNRVEKNHAIGYVWDESTQSLKEVTAVDDLLNGDGSINWDYKYVPTP